MKLLLVTAHFPSYDCYNVTYATPFLYNYAKAWIEQANEVRIVHLARCYPIGFNTAATVLGKLGYSSLEKYIIPKSAQSEKSYVYDGIQIYRIPFFKYVPHGMTPKIIISFLSKKLNSILESDSYFPDLIIGDCLDPVVQVISKSTIAKKCPLYQIIHDTDFTSINNQLFKILLERVDCFLLRSKKQFEAMTEILSSFRYLYMYSGIPEYSVNKNIVFRKEMTNLLYVGALYKSKGIDTILDALFKVRHLPYELTIVGDGVDEIYFKKRVLELGMSDIVTFVGKIPHENVFEYMQKSDILLLISKETFGMVYIEAMSQGCIPIAAFGEGIDGVVIDKENGFLVKLGDSNQLANLLVEIKKMSEDEVSYLSHNAYLTSSNMTHSELANKLLQKIKNKEYNIGASTHEKE